VLSSLARSIIVKNNRRWRELKQKPDVNDQDGELRALREIAAGIGGERFRKVAENFSVLACNPGGYFAAYESRRAAVLGMNFQPAVARVNDNHIGSRLDVA
jgi:hypothetical protein